MMKSLHLCAFVLGVFLCAVPALAQDEVLPGGLIPGTVPSATDVDQEKIQQEQDKQQEKSDHAKFVSMPYVRTSSLSVGDERFQLNTMPSSMLTYWEQVAIVEALNSEGFARPATYSEMFENDGAYTPGEEEQQIPKPPPEERYLSLGGIVYASPQEWTIWLNGKRVTPKALPSEALDLKVRKSYVEIKWFDEYTNQIFPVRLRPHQRFNMDARIFLPG